MEEPFVLKLLKRYAAKVQSIRVGFLEFVNYVEDYVKQHISEETDLLVYWTNPVPTLEKDLAQLQAQHLVYLLRNGNDTFVIVFDHLISSILKQYRKMQTDLKMIYPSFSSLPKYLPASVFERRKAPEFFYDLMDHINIKPNSLYVIEWSTQSAPALVFPSSMEKDSILQPSLLKIKDLLEQEKYQTFIEKRLGQADPTKQGAIRIFLDSLVVNPIAGFNQLQENLNTYWQWTQLCYCIRSNISELMNADQGDNGVLHAALIIDSFANYYKGHWEKEERRKNALLELSANFSRPPYYYTYGTIKKFTDPNGNLLLGAYSDEELLEFLRSAELFTFTVDKDIRSDIKYYLLKKSIIPLINRLKNDAGTAVKTRLIKKCLEGLSRYEGAGEFGDPETFAQLLEKELQAYSPLLHAMFTSEGFPAAFAQAVREKGEAARYSYLFSGDGVVSFGEMFSLTPESIMIEARRELPFWYKLPLVSLIFRLVFFICKKAGVNLDPLRGETQEAAATEKSRELPKLRPGDEWKGKMRTAVKKLTAELVPPGSTLQRELSLYELQWNTTKSVETHNRLTEDVNESVREHVKRTLKSLSMTELTKVRLRKIADTLSSSSGLMKLENKQELNMYIQLYLLRVLETI